MVSSFVYLWPWTFFFGFIGSLIRYVHAKEGFVRNGWFILSALFLICGLGINEMFLSLYATVLSVLAVYGFNKEKRLFYALLPLVMIGLACIAFFVTCPGISHRLANQDVVRNSSHVLAVALVSANHLMDFLHEILFHNVFVLPWVIVASLALPADVRTKLSAIRWPTAFSVIFAGLACILVMSWAYYWPMGTDPIAPKRVQTCLLYGIQIWMWGTTAWISGWALSLPLFPNFSSPLFTLATICSFTILVGTTNSQNNFTALRQEYTDGTLTEYRNLMLQRHHMLSSTSTSKTWSLAVIPDIIHLPFTIFFSPQIYPNREPDYWNMAHERYYGLDEVRLVGDTITKLDVIFSYGTK